DPYPPRYEGGIKGAPECVLDFDASQVPSLHNQEHLVTAHRIDLAADGVGLSDSSHRSRSCFYLTKVNAVAAYLDDSIVPAQILKAAVSIQSCFLPGDDAGATCQKGRRDQESLLVVHFDIYARHRAPFRVS